MKLYIIIFKMKQLWIKSTAKFILYEILCKHKPAISVTYTDTVTVDQLRGDIVVDSKIRVESLPNSAD